jgi:DNA topoisomerase-1
MKKIFAIFAFASLSTFAVLAQDAPKATDTPAPVKKAAVKHSAKKAVPAADATAAPAAAVPAADATAAPKAAVKKAPAKKAAPKTATTEPVVK